ncbi:MAG: hypothetical protein QW666_00065 [Candidatus Woesearchaeota archaeon]
MAKKIIKTPAQRKESPWLIALAIIVLAAIIILFIIKMQTPTGRATTGWATTTLSVSPISSGMVLAITAAAMLLIAIFAGIGKREF